MSDKQIYASVEIANHEVRLVVGEFYETRFNILRVEKVRFNGIEDNVIVNESNVVTALIKAVDNASNILGYRIERILLAIPCVDVKRHSRRVNVMVKSGKVRLSDVQNGINEAIQYAPEENLELVNIGCIKYVINGISSRKLPLNEVCDAFSMEIDLFYANKRILYSYARCVEKAGLQILDICLDAYAIAEEAAIFEQTIENYIVLLNLSRQNTTLSLFSHGKLLSCESLHEGYGSWVSALKEDYNIKTENAVRLIKENATFQDEPNGNRPVFIWAENDKQCTITLNELNKVITPDALEWIERVNDACSPILAMGEMKYILTGDGLDIQGLRHLFTKLNAPASVYVPQTIGGRSCSMSVNLGMFYAWRTLNEIRQDPRICTGQNEVEQGILGSQNQDSEEHGFTKKLKNILMNEK